MHDPHREKKVIGWTERIDFPDWGIRKLKAKVDTGARTSALHVEDVKDLHDGTVRFHVILDKNAVHKRVALRAKVFKWAKVRSSTGHYALRCFVKTRIRVGPVEKEIEVSLVSRQKMVFRMLLGRSALKGDFLVDINKRNVLTPKKPAPRRKTEKA